MSKYWHSVLSISGNVPFFASRQHTVSILFFPSLLLFSTIITLIINIILSGFSTQKLYHNFEKYYPLLLFVHVHEVFWGCMSQCLCAGQRTALWNRFSPPNFMCALGWNSDQQPSMPSALTYIAICPVPWDFKGQKYYHIYLCSSHNAKQKMFFPTLFIILLNYTY